MLFWNTKQVSPKISVVKLFESFGAHQPYKQTFKKTRMIF